MHNVRDLQRQQSNKVCNFSFLCYSFCFVPRMTLLILHGKQITAFGGNKVLSLLRIIERCHQRFRMPPIGPIGAHLV